MEPIIYLFFRGNCLEAMTHYAQVLGGEITSVFRNADAPDPDSRMQGDDSMIMNMNMRIGSTMIMASDNTDEMYETPQGFRISLAPETRAEFDRIHAALAEGARSVEMAPAETFWAERFSMFTDRFGTPWLLNCEGSKREEGST